jgi:hypothetical protein
MDTAAMKINPNCKDDAGCGYQTVPLILIDDDGEPCLAIMRRDLSDWVVKFQPYEASAILSLIGRWDKEIGAKMLAWHEAHERAGKDAERKLVRLTPPPTH